jgi:hypothetical protein
MAVIKVKRELLYDDKVMKNIYTFYDVVKEIDVCEDHSKFYVQGMHTPRAPRIVFIELVRCGRHAVLYNNMPRAWKAPLT